MGCKISVYHLTNLERREERVSGKFVLANPDGTWLTNKSGRDYLSFSSWSAAMRGHDKRCKCWRNEESRSALHEWWGDESGLEP